MKPKYTLPTPDNKRNSWLFEDAWRYCYLEPVKGYTVPREQFIPWKSFYGAVIGDICGSAYMSGRGKTDRPEQIELIAASGEYSSISVLAAAMASAVKNIRQINCKGIGVGRDALYQLCACDDYYSCQTHKKRAAKYGMPTEGKAAVEFVEALKLQKPSFLVDELRYEDVTEEKQRAFDEWQRVNRDRRELLSKYKAKDCDNRSKYGLRKETINQAATALSKYDDLTRPSFITKGTKSTHKNLKRAFYGWLASVQECQKILGYVGRSCNTENCEERNRDYSKIIRQWGSQFVATCRNKDQFQLWLQKHAQSKYFDCDSSAAAWASPIAWVFCEHLRKYPPGSGMSLEFYGWRYPDYIDDEICRITKLKYQYRCPQVVKGIRMVGWIIFQVWAGASKEVLRSSIPENFGYNVSRPLLEIRSTLSADKLRQRNVPIAITAFLESHDFVSAIQNAISVGGDSDTIAAITGSIAEAYYREIPEDLKAFARSKLPEDIQRALGMI